MVIGINDPLIAYDFDMAVSLFGTIIEGRLEEKEEVRRGSQVVGYKPKYKSVAHALGLNRPNGKMIQTTEDAIAAGFILMGKDGKPKAG